MTQGPINDGEYFGYTCNHCGATTETIAPNDDWEETGVPTPDSQFDGTIAHFCPKCSMARELLQNGDQHGDINIGGNILEDLRTWDKALGPREVEALRHFESNRDRPL